MRTFFIILGIALVGFIVWCARTHQPKETHLINIASLMLTAELIRFHGKKRL